jgi:hypothetical protein
MLREERRGGISSISASKNRKLIILKCGGLYAGYN